MNQGIKDKWVEALRSGEFEQGYGALRNHNDEYCCLGVLSELAAREGVVSRWMYGGYGRDWTYGTTHSALGIEVTEWAGLSECDVHVKVPGTNDTLVDLNDGGMRFSEIANVIEREL